MSSIGLQSSVNNRSLTAAAAAASAYGNKQTGRFTTRGCEIKGVHPNHRLRYKYDYVNCSCDHLGAVIVLMDSVTNYDYLSGDDTANIKDLALLLALVVSLLCLLATLFVLACIRGHSIKSNSNSINKNLITILIIIELLILYSIMSRGSLNQHEYQCKLVAIFLHFFSISLFSWLLVNAIHFYRMLTELRDINHGPMKIYHVLGYAVPAFFVSIAVGLRIEQFGNYLFCWLSIHEPIIWSMFGPISLVSMLTIILFKLALCKSWPLDKNHDDPTGVELIKTHLLINLIKTPVIGVYWLVAVYAVNETLIDFAYLFPIVIVLKSLVLFIVLCIVDRYIRYNLYVSWLRLKGEKVAFMDDPLNASGQYASAGLANNLNTSHTWMASAMLSSMPEGEFGRYAGNLQKHQSGQMLYPPGQQQLITPGFQSSCTDIFRPELLAGLSTASTTSRSTATGTSSNAPYRDYQRRKERQAEDELTDDELDGYGRSRRGHRRRHGKKSHRKSHHQHGGRHHHHHHHHHHRSHHQDEYNVSRGRGADNDEDAHDSDHGHRNGGHSHHHLHRHHHHRHHHRDHRHKSSGGGGGSSGHYERTSGAQHLAGSSHDSQHNSLDNIIRNDELASSHSSDQDDVSAMLPKKQVYSTQIAPSSSQTNHDKNLNQRNRIGDQATDGQASPRDQQQTVPMELLNPLVVNASDSQPPSPGVSKQDD